MQHDQPPLEPDHSSSQGDTNEVELSKQKIKVFMPAQYNKAKRNVTKMVTTYFNTLREEIKAGAKVNVDRTKLSDISDAIISYVGLRYNDRPLRMDVKLKSEETKTKEARGGLLSYMPESDKIVCYNSAGKMSIKQINKGKFKLPDVATPIALQNNVYFLDPCNYDKKRNAFFPEGPAFVVGLQGKIKQLRDPIYFRNKCAVVKKGDHVYLLGGEASDRKILTNHCQKYNLKTQESEQIPPSRHKHMVPSACFMPNSNNLWLISKHYIQVFNGKAWCDINMPFSANFLPFQYVLPINQDQILIFGGLNRNQKSQDVKIYNTRYNNINFYSKVLPQGISVQRNNGAAVVQGCVGAFSSIQASVYPQVGVKSNMCEVTYIFQSSAYLNSVIVM